MLRYANIQFYLQTSHTCLGRLYSTPLYSIYSPATEHHRPLAVTHFTDTLRVEGWVDLGGWLQTKIKCCPWESNLDTVSYPIPVLTGWKRAFGAIWPRKWGAASLQSLAQKHIIRRIDCPDWSTRFLHSPPFYQPPIPMLCNGPDAPLKCPFTCKHLHPHLTHGSLGPLESSTQTASWLVQLFLHGTQL